VKLLPLRDNTGSRNSAAIEAAARISLANPIARSARDRNNRVLGIPALRRYPT
jgi:hypothetical protein